MYSDALYWLKRKWDPSGTVQPFALNTSLLPDNVTEFNIFVTKKDIFQSNFKDLQTSWSNENNAKDITKVKLDKTDLYFPSLIAAYIMISHKSGISLIHLAGDDKTPKIITKSEC